MLRGGIDGGFDIPTDRNKQPLIWLDYEVNANGSVLVKTYHRTHPNAPKFASNELQCLFDGDPVDIPLHQFVSVRVKCRPILYTTKERVQMRWPKLSKKMNKASMQNDTLAEVIHC